MGMARTKNLFGKAAQRATARRQANETKGVPVPGTGVRHPHHKRGKRNPAGSTFHPNNEWGATNRKLEDAQRNLNARARRDAVAEGLNEYEN